jgi:protein tyrosine phosphatase (PTP) superfamily phosphohydrolase (DUF442 family)
LCNDTVPIASESLSPENHTHKQGRPNGGLSEMPIPARTSVRRKNLLRSNHFALGDFLGLVFLTIAGCGSPEMQQTAAPQKANSGNNGASASADTTPSFLPEDGPTEADYPTLHNLIQVTDRIYSGAQPHGEAAFADLAKLGVKTVVSVDGARPDLETAEKHGLRYVHIPIQYSSVPEEACKALTRVADEAEGPLYIHCHHGKHRGPAAAAIACIASGASDAKGALAILKKAGTSENYSGLWRDVEAFRKPEPGEVLPELVSVADVGSMVAAMAKIDRARDNLKLFLAADWGVLEDHPDLVAAQEARKIKEGYEAALENLADDSDEQLKSWLGESRSTSEVLETALQGQDKLQATQHFDKLQKACKTCHADYRN